MLYVVSDALLVREETVLLIGNRLLPFIKMKLLRESSIQFFLNICLYCPNVLFEVIFAGAKVMGFVLRMVGILGIYIDLH